MYDLAQKSRNAMKAKLSRLIDPTPGKVDASDYGPEETDMHADRKTGARPRNPRAYKRGGAVAEGDKPKPNAGKVQRKGRKAEWSEEAKSAASARGPVKNETGRRMFSGDESHPVDKRGKRVPEYRASTPIEGLAHKLQKEGPSRGSSSPSQWEAMMEAMPRRRGYSAPSSGGRKITSEPEYAKGGKVQRRGGHPDAAEDRALVKSMVKPECRTARASGGRTKGKTNVNVIIATGPQQPQGGMPGAMPPIGAAPMGPPPMPSPNAVIPGTSPMPGGAPPAGLPPMPRKRGGRTGAGEHTATKMGKYPIETGSGGGRARLDKKDAY